MSNNAHELSNRLVNALDNNYNVVDMHTVNEIISILEKFNITKELLETTRLGKHVNELRRKTTDPALARRAKVLVKRWRDLVIPTVASPGNPGSNRSSAERSTVRRLGGTPLTSPALSRQVVSPAVASPRPVSRPAWGGYESDSQDVILVDDDPPPPPPPPPPHNTLTPPVKRPPSPQPLDDEKKAKRDKKPKKRRGHSRAGSGTETAGAAAGGPWRDRNGAGAGPERRRNGCTNHLDPYTALVNRMPKAGDKKVKTTQELLAQIQQRGARPHSPHSPHSPDVMLIENDSHTIKVESPLRNGSSPACEPTPQPTLPPLEDEREYHECTCGDSPLDSCPAARRTEVTPLHIAALHHAYLPGINGTRAPLHPHQFTVRTPADPDRPGLFANVVPLYKYSDYADDYCVKNMFRVPLCEHLPWTEFAPDPPPLPPPPSPPPLRPYPIDTDEVKTELVEVKKEVEDDDTTDSETVKAEVKSEVDPNERLSPSIVEPTPEEPPVVSEPCETMEVEEAFETEHQDHRTVERTKDKDENGPCEEGASNVEERTCENAASNVERTCENAVAQDLNGQALYDMVRRAAEDIPYDYGQMYSTPVVTLPQDEYEATETLEAALLRAEEETARDELGRPPRSVTFSEWHECARLGDLVALPYVVID